MKIKFLITSLIFLFFIPAFSQEVRIASIGDYGSATEGPEFAASELAVSELIKSWDQSDPVDAIITVGDNNYPDGSADDIETNIGQFYGSFILGHPDHAGTTNRFFPSIGNHDYNGQHDCSLPGDATPYIEYFELPGNEFYYDYVIGNVHFFVVDSDCHQPDGNSANSVQAQWLQTTMTNSPHPWKIVYLHHAPYASDENESTGSGGLRWDYKAWGATAVLGGHYHFYERFLVDDLLFFVNGSGGNDLHEMSAPIDDSEFQYNEKHGAMLMTFTADQANFKMVNIDNEIVDNYTISLGEPCSQTGDADNDGVCDDEDCAPNNRLLPAPEGFGCDDNNPFTNNDIIQSDGCSCAGTYDANGFCNDIPNYIKLGEVNDHAYFKSENTASGWADAQVQSEAQSGYLLSIEDQVEKDFIDPFITGEEDDKIFFIGLSRNLAGDFVWSSDQSVFNESNYTTSPWGGSGLPSSNDFVTIRKWNPSSNISWGAENGNASRRFIIEKSCSIDCSNEGGDSDGDGVCDNFDCSPNDANFPKAPGTSCNDNNPITTADVIQSDGCTCQGIMDAPSLCDNIPNFTKLGILNGKGYYRSDMTASGWENAQVQCEAEGGYLLSVEDQVEKDFIDPFIRGEENEKVYYIGLSRNQAGDFVWSSNQSVFDESNYIANPWGGSGLSDTDDYVTIRKWNPSFNISLGAENGNASRRFILEKVCSEEPTDCNTEGGDSDGDGICDNVDCAPNDANFPQAPGTSCDDNNPNTVEDIIQSDGCTCQGIMETPSLCENIPNFTKLGTLNGRGYYRSNMNTNWENARDQSIDNGGHLLSMETQSEKDFIDQFISGTGDNKIFYIGLSQNGVGEYSWSSDNSVFDENNYTASPWGQSGIPTSGEVVTLRKWSENATVRWGAEGGGAYRKFIFEKTCSTDPIDCSTEGGDSDGDGICDNQDCAPTNSNLPTAPNSTCDDGDANTIDDVIQADGCTCLGVPENLGPDCDEVSFSTGLGSITIENLNAPIEIVKVYDANYNEEFVCINNCETTEIISGLASGIYHIEIQYFTASWETASVCERDISILGSSNFNQNDILESQMLEEETIHLQSQFSIYPNPVEDRLFVKFSEGVDSNQSFKVYNILGQLEKEFVMNPSEDKVFDFGVNDLEIGVYFIYYENEAGRSETKRFIVQ